ncbi:unnamed protein product [Enterobius vermicularis]|uniref:N-terminal acetyltransferase B complex subunit MDM20 homolog n=1 Tax=Enterobius vermicularis TaxID=51028 RepID=A0A0N4V8H8_ENTVE|nr:unnamed protein product [Enterobius vermicularis]
MVEVATTTTATTTAAMTAIATTTTTDDDDDVKIIWYQLLRDEQITQLSLVLGAVQLMPSKSADQVVLERRLRPIYGRAGFLPLLWAAIDSWNNRKAIQEADKVLKKHPLTHCAKALKALALIRIDRSSEAWPLIEEIEANLEELDEGTIVVTCHSFKEAFTPERICSLYERICASQPKNERNLTQLFMSYVRIRNYQLQKKTALSLYKEFPRNPYYFWSVMSVVMQVNHQSKYFSASFVWKLNFKMLLHVLQSCSARYVSGNGIFALSDPGLAKTMYLPLAEKMIRKMIDSNAIKAEAECDLYALVLQKSGKYEESANFLENDPLYKRYSQQPKNLLLYRILYLHMVAKNYLVVFEKCYQIIDEMADDWHIWEGMQNAAFQRMQEETCTKEEKEMLVERMVEKVSFIINSNIVFDGKRRLRGPYIARLALLMRLLENRVITAAELSTHELGDPVKLLLDYIHMFYALPCCFCDVSVFVTLLSKEQIATFLEKVLQSVSMVRKKHIVADDGGDEKLKKPEPLKWFEILYHRMRRAVGDLDHMPPQSKRLLASELTRLMESSKDSSLAFAAYAQLISYLFWDLYTKHGSNRYQCGQKLFLVLDDACALFEMILFLESVQSVSPDYTCRLMLCRAYGLIGAVNQVQRLLQLLDIKYVQRDTLGYFLFGLFEQYGRYNAAIIYYTELTLFFDQSEKEISESVVTAYENGSFLQIPRLIEFLDAINHSLIATGADIENRALSACFAVDKSQHIVETLFGDEGLIDFGAVQDNRDLFAIVSFEGGHIRSVIEEEKSKSFQEQRNSYADNAVRISSCDSAYLKVACLKLKNLLLRCVAATGIQDITAEKFSGFLTELKAQYEFCKSQYGRNYEESKLMQSPPPVYITEFLYGGDLDLLIVLLTTASDLLESSSKIDGHQVYGSVDEALRNCVPDAGSLEKTVAELVKCPIEWKKTLHFHNLLRHCSRVVQTLTLATITLKLLGSLVERLYCDIVKPKKGSKKNLCSSFFAKITECVQKGANDIGSMLGEAENLLKNRGQIFPEVDFDDGEELSDYLVKQKQFVEDGITCRNLFREFLNHHMCDRYETLDTEIVVDLLLILNRVTLELVGNMFYSVLVMGYGAYFALLFLEKLLPMIQRSWLLE